MIPLLLKKIKQQNQLLPYHIILILIFTTIFNLYSPYCDNEEDKKNKTTKSTTSISYYIDINIYHNI